MELLIGIGGFLGLLFGGIALISSAIVAIIHAKEIRAFLRDLAVTTIDVGGMIADGAISAARVFVKKTSDGFVSIVKECFIRKNGKPMLRTSTMDTDVAVEDLPEDVRRHLVRSQTGIDVTEDAHKLLELTI